PASGSTISGKVTVTYGGTDNVGVTLVTCFIDGTLVASHSGSSGTLSWDTTFSPNGSHTLQAKASDAAGNLGTSPLVNVTVQTGDLTPPTSTISAPGNGSTVSATTSVTIG